MTANFRCLGLSDDGRTNRWRLTLPCGHAKNPYSTMFSKQRVQCDECQTEFLVDYDKQTITAAA